MKLRHAAVLAMILIASNVFALTGEQYLPQAKVQLVDARKLALKACRGKIISEELEQEPGSSGLRYFSDWLEKLANPRPYWRIVIRSRFPACRRWSLGVKNRAELRESIVAAERGPLDREAIARIDTAVGRTD
jgi:hypothetical protein